VFVIVVVSVAVDFDVIVELAVVVVLGISLVDGGVAVINRFMKGFWATYMNNHDKILMKL
jgi:hypothetical protein